MVRLSTRSTRTDTLFPSTTLFRSGGDGGSSKTDVYAALNSAGAYKLPLVLCVINNGWAISVPRSAQTGAETLAQKGLAGGLHCLQVDGNDLVVVLEGM